MTAMPPTATADASERVMLWRALGAVGFLTVIPLPARAHGLPTGVTLAGFGPVGLLLGGAVAGLELGLAPVLPLAVRSAVLLAVLAALCGAMHLDGLADSADGLFGGRTPEQRLSIMRDPRVGGYGMAAAAIVVLVEYAALSGIAASRAAALLSAVGLSRAASAVALGMARPARDSGLGSAYSVPRRLLAGWAAFAVASGVAVWLCGWRGVAACCVALTVVTAVVLGFRRRVGGMTGDGFGAVVELSLAGALLCLAAR